MGYGYDSTDFGMSFEEFVNLTDRETPVYLYAKATPEPTDCLLTGKGLFLTYHESDPPYLVCLDFDKKTYKWNDKTSYETLFEAVEAFTSKCKEYDYRNIKIPSKRTLKHVEFDFYI